MKILIFIFTGTWGANHQKAMLQIEIFRDKNPCEYFTSTFKWKLDQEDTRCSKNKNKKSEPTYISISKKV